MTKVSAKDRVKEIFQEVLLAFSQEEAFMKEGPAVVFHRNASLGEPYSFSMGDPVDEVSFYARACGALETIQSRAIYERGMHKGVPFSVLRCGSFGHAGETELCLYGWSWDNAQVFLLAFAVQLVLHVPPSTKLSKERRNALRPVVRALLTR